MKIKNYLLKARLHQYFQDLKIFFFGAVVFLSFCFFIAVHLESIFFFSTKIRYTILVSLFSVFIIILIIFFCIFFLANKNLLPRYKLNKLAYKIGEHLYPNKPDTILNANQLDKKIQINQSKELAKAYVNNVLDKIDPLEFQSIFFNPKILFIKKIILTLWIFILLGFFFRYNQTANAVFRWAKPNISFQAPKPFALKSITGNIRILGGNDTDIKIHCSGAKPDSINLRLLPSQTASHKRDSTVLFFSTKRDKSGFYYFNLPELFQDYYYEAFVSAKYFWQAWREVTSKTDTIFVTDRPVFESFSITVLAPEYSKLTPITQKGNIAAIEGLLGSTIKIDLKSNRLLGSSFLDINQSIKEMTVLNKTAQGEFKINEEGVFTVNLVDTRGITNRDPVPYKIFVIPDNYPTMNVIKPPPVTELGSLMNIPVKIEIEDDYGFSNFQIAYEIQRPSYLKADPFISIFNIKELVLDTTFQSFDFLWDLSDMMLMPEDEIHFHFELYDNDSISGPKKKLSPRFTAKIPSLSDLYEDISKEEMKFTDNLKENISELQSLKKEIESLQLETIKTEELDWDQKKNIEKSMNKITDEIKDFDKALESLNNLSNESEKHDLFSPDLMKKFKELSELIQDVFPNEMLNSMEKLQQALEEMDMETIQNTLKDLADNIEKIEQDLDRYLDIFKRLQAEQKMDEIEKRMEQLFSQQNSLDNEINQNNNYDKSDYARLSQQEKRNLEELNAINDLIKETAKTVEQFSNKISKDLIEYSNDSLMNQTSTLLNKTMQNLSSSENSKAIQNSEKALTKLKEMLEKLSALNSQFKQETVSDMVSKFQEIMRDVIYLSAQEEELGDKTQNLPSNSPQLRDLAGKQQILQDQLKSIISQLLKLSKETFAITPDIGRSIGKANSGMENAKANLTERKISDARQQQNIAMEGLNETTLGILNSIKQMENSGSSSGYEQFMQMMQQMAGQQQNINQQGMQLAMGQMAASAQQQIMQSMLQKQEGIRKSLDQLIQEMKKSGGYKNGELSGIKKEMDEVIRDLQKQRYTRKTKDHQRKILSKMLDSQTSMSQRGLKKERKSISSETKLVFEGPGGLPLDLGQRQNLTIEALNKSINAGYSREHQNMIKRYFNSLNQLNNQDYNTNKRLNENRP
tara:strand:+ start:256 stop:3690 length:3435 start_codon:yes stop_codon:yes gene_type:complete